MENDLKFLIQSHYADLRPSERKCADYLLSRLDTAPDRSLSRTAKEAGVSEPTVLRFLKALGFKGYKEFQYAALTEKNRQEQSKMIRPMYGYCLKKGDRIEDVPARIAAVTIDAMERMLQNVSAESLSRAAQMIAAAKSVSVFGVENSLVVCKDLCTKLLYLGISCVMWEDPYLQQVHAGNLGRGDLAIGISYSGKSRDTVDVMHLARKQGADTIVITNFRDSRIVKDAKLVLCAFGEQPFYGDAIFSRTTQVALIDMIYLSLILSDYDRYSGNLDESSSRIRNRGYRNEPRAE